MPACVIFNPTARGDKARHFRRHLTDLGGEYAFKPTVGPGTATALAAEAVREGFTTIVAAGGDGTVNEVLNGIAAAPDGLKKARLGVIPLGTVNVFAKELGIPTRLRGAWNVIRAGKERLLDLPVTEFTDAQGRTLRRHFAQLAGAGMDARAIELVSWELKKKLGPLAYVVAGFKAWFELPAEITAEADGRRATGSLVLIGNGRFYGGKLPVFPNARLDDGRFDVRIFPRVTFGTILRWGWSALTGSTAASRGATAWQTTALHLTSVTRAPFEVEGDLVGQLPATIRLLPKALRVIAP